MTPQASVSLPHLMTIPVPSSPSGALHAGWRASVLVALTAIALAGCSFDLGSFSSGSDKEEAAKPAPAGAAAAQARVYATHALVLAKSGKTAEALAEFNQAIELDPNNAEALYGRGLLHQGEKQDAQAIEDFTAANGLKPQQAEPLLGRAVSYLALDKFKEAAVDLDEAVQADPQNAQIWTARGKAYERLGDKTKAAESYGRAIGLRPKDDAARSGLARVGGNKT
jgi:Tfp pilus assembly protein PilF